jgi:putative ABC transport system substrate-binding protein
MFAIRPPWLRDAQHVLAAIACAAFSLCSGAQAAGLTVLMTDDIAAHVDFVRQLRERQEPGSRFDLIRLSAADMMGSHDDDRAGPGSHATRGARVIAGPTVLFDDEVTVAVGLDAACSAIDRPGRSPLVLAMLSRLDYESLKGNAALRHPERPIAVLFREPAMADQLALIDAVLPARPRLGVIASAESEPIVSELQRAAQGWDLQIEYAPDPKSLAAALRRLVPRSDALMVLPDMVGDNQAATLAVLRAGAGAGLPVFGTSEGLVRSGGLAAAVSTPDQLAAQADSLGRRLVAGPPAGPLLVEAAMPATVRVNTTVARALGLHLPNERDLTARIIR